MSVQAEHGKSAHGRQLAPPRVSHVPGATTSRPPESRSLRRAATVPRAPRVRTGASQWGAGNWSDSAGASCPLHPHRPGAHHARSQPLVSKRGYAPNQTIFFSPLSFSSEKKKLPSFGAQDAPSPLSSSSLSSHPVPKQNEKKYSSCKLLA